MTEHTPGPWHIDWNGGMAPRILGVRAPGLVREIADVRFHNGSDDPQVHANARLIAAAPETAAERDRLKAVNARMLQALRLMSSAANWAAHESAMIEVRAAISKSERQP